MKLKTKKRLRRLMMPIIFVWVCAAVMVAVIGGTLTLIGQYMLGEPERARDSFKQLF